MRSSSEPRTWLNLSPRQKALAERDAKFRRLLSSLTDTGQIKAVEPGPGEKLGTLKAALAEVLDVLGLVDGDNDGVAGSAGVSRFWACTFDRCALCPAGSSCCSWPSLLVSSTS